MKSLDVIEAAKREITERATTVVLNVDDARLAGWTASLELEGKHVVRAGSSNPECDVRLEVVQGRWTLFVDGTSLGGMEEIVGVQPTNVACALGAAKALGVASATLMERLHRIVPVTHRLNVVTAPSGVVVIDDTFNANPASAAVALRALAALPVKGRRVVVTPGLIELGSEQYNENLRLATHVEAVPAELVIVARTNVVALESAFTGTVRRFDTRDEAVAWVRASLVAGDGVLYLNDLPDHYP
jgi:UDP-N-acetylmuramoyl-tripeptide--D-alanyl-D-alanine ligase